MKKLLVLVAVVAALSFAANTPQNATLGTGSISGVITDSVTGLPVAGARVSAGCCGQSATTGDDGSYTITDLAAGDYVVKAMKCGEYYMKQYPTPVHVEDGQAVTGIDIALRPMGGGGGGNGSISGTVYDKATNQPIAGAKVMITCMKYGLTGDDGTYTITGIADGTYTVRAMKTGYKCASYPDPVVIQGGNAVTGIDFHLVPSGDAALD